MRTASSLSLVVWFLILALGPLVSCKDRASSSQREGRASPASPSPSGVAGGAARSHLPAVRSARILPNPALRNGPILVQVEGEDRDGSALTFRYQWLVNDVRLEGQTQSTLSPTLVKRGDVLTVIVAPFDGKAEGEPYRTESVTVGNTLPDIRAVVFEPSLVRAGERLSVRIDGQDADHDPIRYQFRWWRNNRLMAEGDRDELETGGLVRDDLIAVEVTPWDEAGAGPAKFAEPIVIANSPPAIVSAPPSTVIEGGRYRYLVKAVDPEGDPLTYTLDSAPPGLTIDKDTGRIEWPVAVGATGTYKIRVSVRDNRDGYAFQEFSLTLKN